MGGSGQSVCPIPNLATVSTSGKRNSFHLTFQRYMDSFILKRFINRNWEVLLLCFLKAFQEFSVDLFVIDSKEVISNSLLNNLVALHDYLLQHVSPVILPMFVGAAFACFFLPLSPKRRRLFIDVMFFLLLFRLLMFFGTLNIMTFLPPDDRILLFSQLLLFMPCLLLIWGWIYWRVDTHSVSIGRGRIFSSSTSGDDIPPPYDYFIASFTSLLSLTLDNFDGKTRFARILILLHGVIMWDVLATTFSRAISLI